MYVFWVLCANATEVFRKYLFCRDSLSTQEQTVALLDCLFVCLVFIYWTVFNWKLVWVAAVIVNYATLTRFYVTLKETCWSAAYISAAASNHSIRLPPSKIDISKTNRLKTDIGFRVRFLTYFGFTEKSGPRKTIWSKNCGDKQKCPSKHDGWYIKFHSKIFSRPHTTNP